MLLFYLLLYYGYCGFYDFYGCYGSYGSYGFYYCYITVITVIVVFTSKKVSLRVKNIVYSAMFYQFFCMELQNHGPYPKPNCLG